MAQGRGKVQKQSVSETVTPPAEHKICFDEICWAPLLVYLMIFYNNKYAFISTKNIRDNECIPPKSSERFVYFCFALGLAQFFSRSDPSYTRGIHMFHSRAIFWTNGKGWTFAPASVHRFRWMCGSMGSNRLARAPCLAYNILEDCGNVRMGPAVAMAWAVMYCRWVVDRNLWSISWGRVSIFKLPQFSPHSEDTTHSSLGMIRLVRFAKHWHTK